MLGSESSRIIFPKELPGLVLRTDTVFPKFRITLDAKIREKNTGIRSSVTRQIFIETCTNGAASKESGTWPHFSSFDSSSREPRRPYIAFPNLTGIASVERIQRSNGSRFPNLFTVLLICIEFLLVLSCRQCCTGI